MGSEIYKPDPESTPDQFAEGALPNTIVPFDLRGYQPAIEAFEEIASEFQEYVDRQQSEALIFEDRFRDLQLD